MSDDKSLVTGHRALIRDIRQAMAELELISHKGAMRFDPMPRASSDSPGGRRPPGEDWERPHGLEEWMDARSAYQAKTPERYQAWLNGLYAKADRHDEAWLVRKLTELRDDLHATLACWRHPPVREDQPPTMADAGFKRYVLTCERTVEELVAHYGCSRQYIVKIRGMDWSARDESLPERDARLRAEWDRRRGA